MSIDKEIALALEKHLWQVQAVLHGKVDNLELLADGSLTTTAVTAEMLIAQQKALYHGKRRLMTARQRAALMAEECVLQELSSWCQTVIKFTGRDRAGFILTSGNYLDTAVKEMAFARLAADYDEAQRSLLAAAS